MYINPKWRILTIGDGDLSFSVSLLKNYQPRALTATVFDSQLSLSTKYVLPQRWNAQTHNAKHRFLLTTSSNGNVIDFNYL